MSKDSIKRRDGEIKTHNRREFLTIALSGAASAAVITANSKKIDAKEQTKSEVYYEELKTPIAAHYQVVIAGGGPSGVIAALASTRSGADTLLLERYPFLGGNGTAGLMTCYNGFRNQRPPEALQTVKGIPAEYIAEIIRLGGIADEDPYPKESHDLEAGDIPYCVGFDPEVAKIASLNLIKKEGVKLQLHSWVTAPMIDGERVTGVIIESKSGRQAISADIVIDATGDGDIAARAGAPFMKPAEKGDRMGMSLMYKIGGVPSSIKGPFSGVRTGDRVVRWGPRYNGDGTDVEVLTQAEIETRLNLWEDIKKMKKRPGLESVYLLQTATGIGVRETRRIKGEYTVTLQDAIKGKRFEDVVAISSNPMPEFRGNRYFFEHEGFNIPYRSLIPKKIENLILTGRCISCEQAPFQSARSMAPAMAIGHASGCAAALAAIQRIPPRQLDVKELQKLLIDQNAELRIKI